MVLVPTSTPVALQALHLEGQTTSRFDYSASGPASITLYPDIVKQIRVLIYSKPTVLLQLWRFVSSLDGKFILLWWLALITTQMVTRTLASHTKATSSGLSSLPGKACSRTKRPGTLGAPTKNCHCTIHFISCGSA